MDAVREPEAVRIEVVKPPMRGVMLVASVLVSAPNVVCSLCDGPLGFSDGVCPIGEGAR